MVDFFGSGYDAAEELGLLPALEEIHYAIDSLSFVRDDGAQRFAIPYGRMRALLGGRAFNFMRGDLERVLRDAVGREGAPIRFSTTIDAFRQSDDRHLHVSLSDGTVEEVDLLVGADGVPSATRSLMFGDGSFVRELGYHAAAYVFEDAAIREHIGRRFLTLTDRGRQVSVYPIRGGRVATFWIDRDDTPIAKGTAGQGASMAVGAAYVLVEDRIVVGARGMAPQAPDCRRERARRREAWRSAHQLSGHHGDRLSQEVGQAFSEIVGFGGSWRTRRSTGRGALASGGKGLAAGARGGRLRSRRRDARAMATVAMIEAPSTIAIAGCDDDRWSTAFDIPIVNQASTSGIGPLGLQSRGQARTACAAWRKEAAGRLAVGGARARRPCRTRPETARNARGQAIGAPGGTPWTTRPKARSGEERRRVVPGHRVETTRPRT
jgi:hypothetical protein